MTLYLRTLSAEEQAKITRLARAQSAPARLVRRARIIQLAAEGETVPQIATRLHLSAKAVRQWVKRFHAAGLAG